MSTLLAEFTVVGTPVPQGSTRAFAGKKGTKAAGKVFTTNDPTGSIGKWRSDVKGACERNPVPVLQPLPTSAPVSMRLTFRLPRPKKHFLPVNGMRLFPQLRADAPTWAIGKPDGDKLERAVLDALTGLLYVDDAQVVVVGKTKRYVNPGEQPGVDVRVTAL